MLPRRLRREFQATVWNGLMRPYRCYYRRSCSLDLELQASARNAFARTRALRHRHKSEPCYAGHGVPSTDMHTEMRVKSDYSRVNLSS
jgi:hypothetical protein